MMKKTTLAILISLFCVSTLAACSTVNTTVLPAEDEYTFTNEKVLAEPDEGFTIDGILNESAYLSQNTHYGVRLDPIYPGNMTTTTYFGEKGIYLGFEVYDSVPVHCNYKRPYINNSCVTMQMCFDSASKANASLYNINLVPDGRFSFEGLISSYSSSEWGDYTMYFEKSPVLGVDLQGGTINGDDCHNYTLEFFIPYGAVGLSGAPNTLLLNTALRSYDSEALIGAAAVSYYRFYEEKENLTALGLWKERFYTYDENGLVCNEVSFSDSENGKIEEYYGRDYTLKDVPARFVIKPNEGYCLKEITANGKDILDRITIKDNKIILDLGYVNEDLEIDASFEEISSSNITISGTINNTANYDISALEMILTDGVNIYEVEILENGEYSATVPIGRYVAIYSLDKEIFKTEIINLSSSTDIEVNTSSKIYVSNFEVTTTSAHKQIINLGTNFRADCFVGMENLDFNYDATAKEFFGARVVFRTDTPKSADFQLLRWDNRILLKNLISNESVTLMTLTSDSTTKNPKYITDFSSDIAEYLIDNNGLNITIERNGEYWNAYIRIESKYYLMFENVQFDGISETDDVTNIWLQAATATSTNPAYIKDMTVFLYPIESIVPEDRPTYASTGSNTQVKGITLGQNFRVEMFVGMDSLDFNYWTEGTKQKYNICIVFSIDGTTRAGVFSLIGYDNRVMLKEETNNNSVKLFVLSEGSTTANPKYTTDYPDVVAQSIIQNKGITMVLERNGSLWNTYVKVGDTYYLVHSGVACGNIGTNDITNILVQCSEATTSNRACVKDVTISENPSAITKLAYKSNGIATTASNADVSAVLVSGDFRAEFFIGKDALNYDYQTGTASEQFGVQCRFYNTTTNANANFQLLRWGNKIYIKNTNNNKGFVIMELSSDSTTSSPKYTATEGWEAVCEELIKNNGLTFMVERINGKWNVYAKVNDVYYKALENLDINDMGTNDIDMVKLQSGNATSTNRAIVKDLVIDTNLSND